MIKVLAALVSSEASLPHLTVSSHGLSPVLVQEEQALMALPFRITTPDLMTLLLL